MLRFLFIAIITVSLHSAQDNLKTQTIKDLWVKKTPSLLFNTKTVDTYIYKEKISYPVLTAAAASGILAGYALVNYYNNVWWDDQRTKFKFRTDWDYALWSDKFGHLFAAYTTAHLFSSSLDASGMDPETSVWLSAGTALLFQTYVEIQDGQSPKWGFDVIDQTANIVGSGWFLLRYYIPELRNVLPKMSYYPSEAFRNLKDNKHDIIEDYDGQKFWLSFRVKNLLPSQFEKYWPSFLMLSVGYGIKDRYTGGNAYSNFHIAFDIDMEELPVSGKFADFLKNTLNLVHFPMPGITINKNGIYAGIIF